MSPLDVSRAIPMASEGDFDRWLSARGRSEREIVVAIYKKSSAKQTVTLAALQETALCHGWVDTQTKGIDEERYAIRFAPRRPGSTWAPSSRRLARRLLEEGRIRPAGLATLPEDL